MRVLFTVFAMLGLMLAAGAAGAQQSQDWNNPSQQQQQDIKQTRDGVRDGLNNIGDQENSLNPGNYNAPPPTGLADQINDTTRSVIDQGSQVLDSIPGR